MKFLQNLLGRGRAPEPAAPPAAARAVPPDPERCIASAEQLRRDGQLQAAAAAYEAALAAGAQPGRVLLQLGAVQTELEAFAAAERSFASLVAVEPGHADAWCMLGVVTKEQKRFEEAIRHFGQALALQPDFPEAYFNLGLAQFELGRLADASASFMRCAEFRRGAPWREDHARLLQQDPSPPFEPMYMGVNEVKLRHDCEQLAWLLDGGILPPVYRDVIADYQAVLGEIRGQVDENTVIPFDEQRHVLLARTYKRPIHIAEVPPPGAAIINPALDFEDIQDRYLAAQPHVLALDNLLTPEALEAMRRFCRQSTIWNNIKGGYLGAYFYDGFCSELLLRLAWELRARMPRVIADHSLQMMWGYKCDCTLPGLAVHADAAAVNVNFWITEDEANLDPEGGGLVVYEQDAPKDWDFRQFNNDTAKILAYLESIGSVPRHYPYRANRALVFDSDLFHATDSPRFKEGYLNRRINITLLYGNRQQ